MTRQDLLDSIKQGEEFLERQNLTPAQRRWGEERVARNINKLAELGDEPEPQPEPVKESRPIDSYALERINNLREFFGMPRRQA